MPEIAARAHVEAIDRIVARALRAGRARAAPSSTRIAAAAGPGLVGGVMVGLTTAKAIALVTGKPFIAVNHLEAHALTARLTDNLAFPYLLLLVSGGHTQLLAVRGVGDYLKLGGTIDDAVGEAFDKIAKMLGLPYPGGPSVEREAEKGDPERFDFPAPDERPADAGFLAVGAEDRGAGWWPSGSRRCPTATSPISAPPSRRRSSMCWSTGPAPACASAARSASRPTALVVAGGVSANQADPARPDAARHRGRPADGRAASGPVRRQWRDDRLGRAGAAAARLVDDMSALARPRWPLDELGPTPMSGATAVRDDRRRRRRAPMARRWRWPRRGPAATVVLWARDERDGRGHRDGRGRRRACRA